MFSPYSVSILEFFLECHVPVYNIFFSMAFSSPCQDTDLGSGAAGGPFSASF